MFSLYINSQQVIVPEDFDFGVVLESPLYNRRGNYSYPFKVPYEPNKHIFGHLKELSAAEPDLPFTFEIRWAGTVKFAGNITSLKYSSGSIELILMGAKSAFYRNFTGLYLDDIDIGNFDYSGYSAEQILFHWSDSGRWDKDIYGFPVYANYPFVFAPMSAINFFEAGTYWRRKYPGTIINLWDPVINNLVPDNLNTCSIYLLYLLEQLIDYAGYTLRRNDLLNAGEGLHNYINVDFRRLYLPSCVNVRPSDFVNGEMHYRHFLPHITVTSLFDKLMAWIGLSVVADDKNLAVDLVLLKEIIKDDRIEIRLNRSVLSGNRERKTFTPTGIKLKYALEGEEYNGNTDQVNDDSILVSVNKYEDLPTASLSYLKYIYKLNINFRKYQCQETSEDVYEWVLVGELASVTKGTDPEEREIEIQPTLTNLVNVQVDTGYIEATNYMRRGYDYIAQSAIDAYIATFGGEHYYETIRIEFPSTLKSGIAYADYILGITSKPDNGFSLLIYQGMKAYTADVPVKDATPYFQKASYDKYPIRGADPDGWLSLKLQAGLEAPPETYFDPESGWWIFKTNEAWGLFKNYNALAMSWEIAHKRPLTIYVDIPDGDVFNFNFLQKYLFDNLSFIIDKIHVNFKRKRISSVKLEVFPITGGVVEAHKRYFLKIDSVHYLKIDPVHKQIIR